MSLTSNGRRRKVPQQIYTVEEANDRLADIFHNHDFGHITHVQRHLLAQFYHLLMGAQKRENFTRLVKFHDIAIKHFIDCLIVPRLVNVTFPLLDMGTGPGFPGIPLKILFPEAPIYLAEGVQRRVSFLKEVRDQLDLKELHIFGRNIDPTFEFPMRSVITRAVTDVHSTLKACSHCLSEGGQVILMRGPHTEGEKVYTYKKEELRREELQSLEQGHLEEKGKLGRMGGGDIRFLLEKDIAYTLPKTPHQRRLLVYSFSFKST